MVRISGVVLPGNKNIEIALTAIKGIGRPLARRILEELKNPTSPVSEAYSALIAALRYSTEDGMPKVLSLTSAGPGEGKSSSAFAIAQTYARLGRRVDACFRLQHGSRTIGRRRAGDQRNPFSRSRAVLVW